MTETVPTRMFPSIAVLFGVVLSVSLALDGVRGEEFAAADFVPLFNGTDFAGWRFGDESAAPRKIPASWRIEDVFETFA